MELKEAIAKRNSIRAYKDTPVPEEKLNAVLEAARLAPSGANKQEWKFVVVRNEEKKQDLAKATGGQAHVSQAPVVIAAVATETDFLMRCDVPAYPVDLAIAIDHMTLAAVDEGLGTCWIGAFSQEKAMDILRIPDNCRIVSLLTLGYPAEEGRPKTRKSLEEIVCYDSFRD